MFSIVYFSPSSPSADEHAYRQQQERAYLQQLQQQQSPYSQGSGFFPAQHAARMGAHSASRSAIGGGSLASPASMYYETASPHGARLLGRISALGDRVARKSPANKLGGTPGSLRRRPRM